MSNFRQTIFASPPAAMLLALAMAVLTAPVLMLSHVRAAPAPAPTLPCTVGNANGCTELSPIPPEDTAAVPPNIVLMLDDSGSMSWDYMPDWGYLKVNNNQAARDWQNNSLYYNPTYNLAPASGPAGYVPPPQADGTSYPPSPGLTNAYNDGFLDLTAKDITAYQSPSTGSNHPYPYYTTFSTSTSVDKGPAVPVCPSGYHDDGSGSATPCQPNSLTPPTANKSWQCPNPPGGSLTNLGGGTYVCRVTVGEGWVDYPAVFQCPNNYTWSDTLNKCVGPVPTPKPYNWTCPNGGSANAAHECILTTTTSIRVFTIDFHTVSRTGTWTYAAATEYYIAAGNNCSNIPAANQPRCVNEDDVTGKFPDGTISGPPGVPIGQNVANWFSYYRTRMLMAKSGLMFAFQGLDPKYRFGFASLNAGGATVGNIPSSPAPYGFDDSMGSGTGGNANNLLAVVQPFGDGSAGTQKANFWKWIANQNTTYLGMAGKGETPLRKALNAVGQYYQTSQPWSSMTGDPGWTSGSSTTYACRASYTILTTDGFWDGDNPTDPAGLAGAANTNGPVNTVPSGDITQYTAAAPFSGGAADSGASLADVATYYWANDLQPGMPNEVSTSTADPAAWQHMTTFTVGLGFTPVGILPTTTTVPQIFAWAHGGSPIAGFSWPTPSQINATTGIASGSVNNIADLAHAAVNGHGDFFNVTNPADLATAFQKAIRDIAARTIPPTTAATNSSVLSLGALSFSTGYSTGDWSGALQAVTLNADGSVGDILWKAGVNLDADFHSASTYSNRKVYTGTYNAASATPFSVIQFNATNAASLDTSEKTGLGGDASCPTGSTDTLCNRINYLLGDPTNEGTLYRTRTSILGAIIRSQPVYVAAATGNYYGTWPTFGGIAPPENAVGAQTYNNFVSTEASRPGMVYIGANDGMLHAFQAPVPQCTATPDPTTGNCPSGDYSFPSGANPGHEVWAYVPRAVYANLGNLTNASDFAFLPTVDATPVTRDVFFSEGTRSPDNSWHTILAGGVGLGGRGVYALDITDPTSFSASTVLWEFDSDMTAASVGPACVASYGSCTPSDLGYTLSQPNIGRLANGKWVVIVPNGYFPDCTTPDIPTGNIAACQAVAAQAPGYAAGTPYSALFVMDAETGKMLAELKTPTSIGGVPIKSFGLATPVLGDYNGDQVDDVAFAGDALGNLWRFDLSDPSASNWTVTLVYKGGTAYDPASGTSNVVQPITSMPRLFPDPTTNRFMVVFGTGRFLGIGDNSDNTTQSVYGVRDVVGKTWTQADLVQQYLHEEVAPATLADGVTPNPFAGASLRCVTGGASDTCDSPTAVSGVPAAAGGWYVNLYTTTSDGTRNDAGERVVVTPGAIFSSNTAVIGTLITGSQSTDACNPSTQGSILALNVLSGGSAGMSSLGGGAYAGGRITNAPTSGTMPIASALGGVRAFLPGAMFSIPGSPTGIGPASLDQPAWRRRSWSEINQNQ